MAQRPVHLLRWLSACVVLLTLLAACGASDGPTTALPAASPPAGGAAVASGAASTIAQESVAPTAIPRTGDPKDVIVSTTTSTQDSGLLDALVPVFERQSGYRVKTIAVGSGAAIALGQRGEADVVLAHAPDNERTFVASGAGITRTLVMYNDFLLVGPAADPAKVTGQMDIVAALSAIASAKAPFISRGDNSGTHQLERKLWKAANLTPSGHGWYTEAGAGMGQTLQIADQRNAYTISDRATYLAFKERVGLTVVVEGDPRLLNLYHVIAVNPQQFPQVNAGGAQAFITFLVAPETQALISTFGRETYNEPLFTACANNSCGLADPDG